MTRHLAGLAAVAALASCTAAHPPRTLVSSEPAQLDPVAHVIVTRSRDCAPDDRMPVHRPAEVPYIPNARPGEVVAIPNACPVGGRSATTVIYVAASPPADP